MTSGVVGFVGFGLYLLLFLIIQFLIGSSAGVRGIQRGDVVTRFLMMAMGSVLLMPSALLMRDAPMCLACVVIGSLLTLTGLVLSMWAQKKLGRNWVGGVGLHDKHKLVQGGPYRHVRHPLYSGMILSSIGLGLIGTNVIFAVAMLCTFGSFALRIPAEEKLLEQKFGKKWRTYRENTGALFPKIRKER